MKTGEKIRNRRLELNMTMEDLGNAIGVQRSAINKYEKGTVDIKSSTLSAIANALNVPIGYLLDDLDDVPQTLEARIISGGIDKMSKERREQALKLLQVAFKEFSDLLKEDNQDGTQL